MLEMLWFNFVTEINLGVDFTVKRHHIEHFESSKGKAVYASVLVCCVSLQTPSRYVHSTNIDAKAFWFE